MAKPIQVAMLIDDEEIDQRVYRRVLEKSDLVERILVFTYAEDALSHLKENPDLIVDVIFLDINMPRMNGFDFLDVAFTDLGPRFSKTVVAMLSTASPSSDQTKAAENHRLVTSIFPKPLTSEHVTEAAELVSKLT